MMDSNKFEELYTSSNVSNRGSYHLCHLDYLLTNITLILQQWTKTGKV